MGVSFDPPEVLMDFAEQYGFPFLLLSDQDHKIGELYETKREPEESNPDYAKRRTYLIDPERRIVRAYRVTDIPAHPGQVLEDIRSLRAAASG